MAAPAPDSVGFGAHTIVSPARRLGFVMTEDQARRPSLVAVDLGTGKQRWRSTAAVKPIVLRGDKLVALGPGGAVIILDAKTGALAKPCSGIKGPAAPFIDGLGISQSAWGFDDGSALYLAWSRSTFYSGGAAPSPEMEARARTRTDTTWALDLTACTAKVAKPVIPSFKVLVDATTEIATPSGKTARIEYTQSSTGVRLTLVPAAATTTTPIDLTEGDVRRYQASISIDHRFVICGDPSNANLAMFDLETGAVTHPKLTGFPYSWMPLGNTIVVAGGSITAFATATGKSLWTVAERVTMYRGPYPP
jgi:hypothetical protein